MMNIDLCRILPALALASLAPAAIRAQELHENVSVEGTYRPDIIKAERFNTFPEHVSPKIETTPLAFDTRGVTAAFTPEARALGIVGWRTDRAPQGRGYLHLDLGSWLNSSLSAGYAAIDNDRTRLHISLQHNSSSLWRPYGNDYPGSSRRYNYDESLAARFCHTFSRAGLLEAQLQYRFSAFNYYSFLPSPLFYNPTYADAGKTPEAPGQTLNDIAFRVGFSSPTGSPGRWHAALRTRYFGMRDLYIPGYEGLQTLKATRETLIGAEGGYSFAWNCGSSLGIDADLSALLYNNPEYFGNLAAPSDYAMLRLRPYYSFTRDNLIVSVGAAIDLAFNAPGSDAGSHYSLFHIAPDVKADLKAGPVGLYIHLGGGSALQTLSGNFERFYYTMPALACAQPVYTPLDGRLGIQFGPFSGFSAGLEAAYRTSSHVPFSGWYPAMLNYGTSLYPGLERPGQFNPLYALSAESRRVHGWRFRLNAAYAASIFKLEGDVAYMPQSGQNGWTDGLDRTRWELSAKFSIRPIKPLHLAVGYKYRGVRFLDMPWDMQLGSGSVVIDGKTTTHTALRLDDLCMLNAEASWNFTSRFSIGVSADNLLNHKTTYLPSLPLQGIDIRGNITLTF